VDSERGVIGEEEARCARHASMRPTLRSSASLAARSSSSSPSAALEQYESQSSSSRSRSILEDDAKEEEEAEEADAELGGIRRGGAGISTSWITRMALVGVRSASGPVFKVASTSPASNDEREVEARGICSGYIVNSWPENRQQTGASPAVGGGLI
jgi:hypothetical protein